MSCNITQQLIKTNWHTEQYKWEWKQRYCSI